ncbi:hypothetical protein KFL_000380160 [Klebsormidium nitens]|uniref:Uncharacterized protein n=1 Tax=Klebsormidium nitens TaxID=105231 RepID=A0A1Y1HPT2_KLENI|nr:hypothetical protein KFL_000380160 [Klebsormidium nitens]|eukprot:GAQ79782.1 hypothetical protein KFL_000380160 [Klebsormidium nitens]
MDSTAYEKVYLYGQLIYHARKHGQHTSLLERIAFYHVVLKRHVRFESVEEMNLVTGGFAIAKKSVEGFWATISEPIALTAIVNFLTHEMKWTPEKYARQQMAISSFNHSMMGQWWEFVAARFLPPLFETDRPLGETPLFSNLKGLPSCFYQGTAHVVAVSKVQDGLLQFKFLGDRSDCLMGMAIANPGYTLLDFLEDPKQNVLFFPEDMAGPDLVFFLSVAGLLYLVFVQVKLRKTLGDRFSVVASLDPSQAYRGKANRKALRAKVEAALQPGRGVTGVISVFLGYPLCTTLPEGVELSAKPKGSSKARAKKGTEGKNLLKPKI